MLQTTQKLCLNFSFFVLATVYSPARAESNSCASPPSDAFLAVPVELSDWFRIVCLKSGHELVPGLGQQWVSTRNSNQITFPALGIGRTPANVIESVGLVVGRSGAYPLLIDGSLMSPHDATFQKGRAIKMDGPLLLQANKAAFEETKSGPFPTGYLFDLLSNQGFQYRLYVLADATGPKVIVAIIEMLKMPSKSITVRVVPNAKP